MVQRVRLPVQGGNVKIVSSPAALSGTTIAGFEGQSLTISQLAVQIATALGLSTQAAKSPGSSGSAAAAIVLGPGLTGGGPVVGAVPINLNASIPWNMQDDPPEAEWLPVPGQPGARGAQGSNGPGVYLMDDPPEADWLPVPGQPGATGATGPQGPAGSGTAAAAGMWIPEDAPEADWMPVPGAQGARGLPGIAAAVGCWIPEDATDDPLIVGYGPQIQLTIPVGANPSATIGLTAVNGSATTFTRSDGAPALSQAIAPTWTGAHNFTGAAVVALSPAGISIGVQATSWPTIYFNTSTAGANNNIWTQYINGSTGSLNIQIANDALNAVVTALQISRSAMTLTGISAYGPVAASLVDLTPDTGIFTITYTGFTTSVTGTARWNRIGNIVHLLLPGISGTSNANTFTMTGLPAAIQPANPQSTPFINIFNSGSQITNGWAQVSGGVITMVLGSSPSAWSSTGTKGLQTGAPILISYSLN